MVKYHSNTMLEEYRQLFTRGDRKINMITKEQATDIVLKLLADNLVILSDYDNENEWCFTLGLKRGDKIAPIMGDDTVRINKVTGEVN